MGMRDWTTHLPELLPLRISIPLARDLSVFPFYITLLCFFLGRGFGSDAAVDFLPARGGGGRWGCGAGTFGHFFLVGGEGGG